MRFNSRPASIAKTSVVTFLAFVACFIVGSLLCTPLIVSGGYVALVACMAVNSIACFAVPGLIARPYAVGRKIAFSGGRVSSNVLVMVFLTAMLCQPFIQWAAYLDSLISQAIGMSEDMAEAQQQLLGQVCVFTDVWHWAAALITVALLPAVSEELFFRGALQPLIKRMTGNWHVAVGLTAAIFSAVHLDPSGFLSRFILGAILGALLVITKSLWAPMLFHFTNNAFAVVAISMAESPEEAFNAPVEEPDIFFTCMSLAFTIAEIFFISQAIKREKEANAAFGQGRTM